jgi:2-hydroxymuconate-semialdehyde hydrolase
MFRVLAPDLIGFGYTSRPDGFEYRFMQTWIDQMQSFFDAQKLDKVDIVGNSFGGSLALAIAVNAPDRVRRIVLMGSGGVSEKVTPELEQLWGYTPSVENMKGIMQIMAYNHELVTTELAEMRYRASIRPGIQETFERLFPPPRQRWLDAQAQREDDLRALPHQVLIVHGREDRVVPLSGSHKLAQLIPNSQLHVFGKCGHWTMIEQRDRFNRLVIDFLTHE